MKKLFLAVCMLSLVACNNQQKQETETTTETITEIEVKEENKKELDVTLEWVAYKFEEKEAVKGIFTEFDLEYNKEGVTPEEKLSNLKFTVDKESANTDDPERDKTIVDNFFLNLKGGIHGSLGKMEDGTVPVTITLNEKSVTKDFTYEVQNNEVHFKGEIDILEDFMADTAFKALHDACAVLHLDKTWTDVAINVSVKM
ncbi:MAG TPA: hypothetical protein VKX30_00800 [Flavobacteriaceae bacterium]|nr:hypothetical protein [Flavobacteriaceae bacterium]